MRNKFFIFLLIEFAFHIIVSCSTKWTQAIRSGEVAQNQFRETVDVEIRNGLIFIPVTIRGKEYRFLFDSGAPFSISNKLQSDYAFEIVSKGKIIDSDHNKKKVKWVEVESINIGNVSFQQQTAFIGDFKANPILRCLEVDGIIGSNLLRHCNWTIDQEHTSLTFFNSTEEHDLKGATTIPFKTDYQFNMYIDLDVGPATVSNVLVDYGSNGSVALDDEIFKAVKDRNIIHETLTEKGMQRSGIVGKSVDLSREIVYTDSVSIDSIHLKKVMLRTGKTVSIGNDFLSRFRVTIDWNNKTLHLIKTREAQDSILLPGFKLGYSANEDVFVQSIVENSNAYREGVRPKMKVIKLDTLDFENGNDFCDYVSYKLGDTIFMELIDSNGHRMEYYFEQTVN